VPEKRGSRDIGREDRPIQRIIYLDFRGIRSGDCLFRSGVSSGSSTAHESYGGNGKEPGEQDSVEIEALLIPNRKH
jgi:hypothetical protein